MAVVAVVEHDATGDEIDVERDDRARQDRAQHRLPCAVDVIATVSPRELRPPRTAHTSRLAALATRIVYAGAARSPA